MLWVALLLTAPQDGGIVMGTGNEFLATCADWKSQPVNGAACLGFVRGFGSGLDAGQFADQVSRDERPRRLWACIPTGVNGGQVLDLSIKYLREHPETRHQSTGVLLSLAFRQAFPCPPEAAK